jgi:hypothetical protein
MLTERPRLVVRLTKAEAEPFEYAAAIEEAPDEYWTST